MPRPRHSAHDDSSVGGLMGLAEDLGYRHATAGPLRALVRSIAGTRAGAAALSRTLPRLDGLVGTATRGRHSAASLFTGLAVATVTTTGRRSGQPRSSHLIAIPHGDTLALIGTNFGQASTPAWVHNLRADPRARIAYRDRAIHVVARPLTGTEVDEVFERAARDYAGYRHYRHRIGDRRPIRVFALEPAAATDDSKAVSTTPPD